MARNFSRRAACARRVESCRAAWHECVMGPVEHPDLALAARMADAARAAILPFFRQSGLLIANKQEQGFDPVTRADRAAERAMRALIEEHRPKDGILGEEFGDRHSRNGRTWVLDPIDGTRGFIAGTPTWGVLIALSGRDGPVLGLIDQPYIGERFVGLRAEQKAHMIGPMGETPLTTRSTRTISEAIVLTTFPEVGTPQERAGFEAVAGQARLTRYGMDCYGYALLAAGQVDLVIEAGLKSYDIQAPIAVVEAAGGVLTDWLGHPVHHGGRSLAAANAHLHAQALELLKPFA